MPRCLSLAFATLLVGISALPVLAANFEIHMKNKGEAGAMVFEPAFANIAVGDTITFIPADKGHNAETIPNMLPEGAAPFKGKMNEEIVVPFPVPGVYGIRCAPHFGLGMVAVV